MSDKKDKARLLAGQLPSHLAEDEMVIDKITRLLEAGHTPEELDAELKKFAQDEGMTAVRIPLDGELPAETVAAIVKDGMELAFIGMLHQLVRDQHARIQELELLVEEFPPVRMDGGIIH